MLAGGIGAMQVSVEFADSTETCTVIKEYSHVSSADLYPAYF